MPYRLTLALCALCSALVLAPATALSAASPSPPANPPSPPAAPIPPASPQPSGSPGAVSAPLVVTGVAGIDPNGGFVFMGEVNAEGAATTFWFEYGLTTGYGSTASPGCGNGPVSLAGTTMSSVRGCPVSLTPSSTYHYRLVARNSAGTTDGADQTFATPIPSHPSPPPKGAGRSCAHPFKLVIHHNGDSSTGDRRHINVLVSPPVGMEWNPIGKVEICSASGVDTNGKHWRVTGHPRGARHSFAKGTTVQTATITARLKKK